MPIVAYQSSQRQPGRKYPIEQHGKARFAFFNFAATVVGDANSTIELCTLPHGRVRLLPFHSRVIQSAFGAGRTLSIGHAAYVKADDISVEPENLTALATAIDISAASSTASGAALVGLKYDFFSQKGIVIKAIVAGGTVPNGATISGVVSYICE